MTQVKRERNWDGNRGEKEVNLDKNLSRESKKSSGSEMFIENQIVPMWASTKVAAAMLGISPNALRIRKCRGEIECRYFGKYLRFNVNQLQSLFRDSRQE